MFNKYLFLILAKKELRINTTDAILIAFGLAMDCFAVSITGGAAASRSRISDGLKVGLYFGPFRAAMPLIEHPI